MSTTCISTRGSEVRTDCNFTLFMLAPGKGGGECAEGTFHCLAILDYIVCSNHDNTYTYSSGSLVRKSNEIAEQV